MKEGLNFKEIDTTDGRAIVKGLKSKQSIFESVPRVRDVKDVEDNMRPFVFKRDFFRDNATSFIKPASNSE
jgi:hypothetical protein